MIWLLGTVVAMIFQIILVQITISKLHSMISYIYIINKKLEKYGLIFDINKNKLTSKDRGVICPIYSSFQVPKYIETGVLIQSLMLSWINVLIILFGIFGALVLTAPEIELEEEEIKLNDPAYLSAILKQICTDSLGHRSIDARVNINLFIDEHIELGTS